MPWADCFIAKWLIIYHVFYLLNLKNTTERMRGQWPEYLVSKILPFLYKRWQSQNWNEIFNDTGEESYDKFISAVHNIYQQAFPLVRVSRKVWRDKPWLTKALEISIKHKNKLHEEDIKQNTIITKIVCANAYLRQRKTIIMIYLKIIRIPCLISGKL